MDPQDFPSAEQTVAPAVRRSFAPEVFGKYYLLDKIAVGGMAEVFRAKSFGHQGFERLLVIKRILARFAESPEFEAMFVDEAKVSVQLNHPNVVHVYDFGKVGSNLFLAMEAVDGRNLKSVMRRLAEHGELLPTAVAVYIAHEVAKGLDYAHRRNDASGRPLRIVHRDVSPANILVSYEGAVKIVDFGIAKAESTRPEEEGILKGKFQYMSPEQARGEEVDQRSDLFSVGICLWEMLTGNRLFRRSSDLETLEAIRSGEVPLPSSYNPSVPTALDRIVLKALSLDPDERYPDGASLQRDLQDFLLPETPDRLQPVLAALLHDRFAAEMALERETLERATASASELHYGGEVDLELDEPSGAGALDLDDLELDLEPSADRITTTHTIRPHAAPPEPPPARRGPSRLIGVLGLLLLGLLGAVLWMQRPAPEPQFATLEVNVLPEGVEGVVLTLGGEPIPARFDRVVPDVAHVLRGEAPGRLPAERTLELTAGQVYAVDLSLQPVPEEATEEPEATPAPSPRSEERPRTAEAATPAPEPEEQPLADAPRVRFQSDPAGARLYIDGRRVGQTPYVWSARMADSIHNVEYRLDGHASVQAVVRVPGRGEEITIERTLPRRPDAPEATPLAAATPAPTPGPPPAEAAAAGKLSVQATPGWARVFLNGNFLKTTPVFEHELPPGRYELRIVSERRGVDRTESITVRSGEVTRKTYRLDE